MEIGDMVRLTSGGPKMVVTLARNACADTAWFDGDRLQRGELLPLDTLELVGEEDEKEGKDRFEQGEEAGYMKAYQVVYRLRDECKTDENNGWPMAAAREVDILTVALKRIDPGRGRLMPRYRDIFGADIP